jgi:hypothetical protein
LPDQTDAAIEQREATRRRMEGDRPSQAHRSVAPAEAALRRDDALARLADRVTGLVDRELLRDDKNFLSVEEVREALDAYITDAVRHKDRLKGQPGAEIDPVTAIVHCDGGIDALQEMRERLLGDRLDLDKVF